MACHRRSVLCRGSFGHGPVTKNGRMTEEAGIIENATG
jgi:hypothetical protein